MRGTAGGMLMLQAFAAVAGVALAAPFLATVSLVLGRKMLKDERVRQLAQRRILAKQAVRKYTDDLAFTVGKDSRDTLRRINRQLRDTFLQRAEELTTSTSESLTAAQQAAAQLRAGPDPAAARGGRAAGAAGRGPPRLRRPGAPRCPPGAPDERTAPRRPGRRC